MRYIYTLLLSLLLSNSHAQHGETDLVADICTGPCSSTPYGLCTSNGNLIFSSFINAQSALYTYNSSDGLKKVYTTEIFWITCSAALNDTVYYLAFFKDGTSQGSGLVKWNEKSQPTLIESFTVFHRSSDSKPILSLNNKIYYTFGEGHTYTINEYDPSTGSIKVIAHTKEQISTIINIGNKIVYTDISKSPPDRQYSMYGYDVVSGRTDLLIKDHTHIANYMADEFCYSDGNVYFMASPTPATRRLYRYDGASSPVPVWEIQDAYNNKHVGNKIACCNGKIYFQWMDATTYDALWVYDIVTGACTKLDILNHLGSFSLRHMITYHDKLLMNIYNANSNQYNGGYIYDTKTNEHYAMPKPTGVTSFTYMLPYLYNDAVYLYGTTKEYGEELFRYTEAPQVQAKATLYPNPTTGNAFIKIHSDTLQALAISIHDAVGHELLYQNIGDFHKGEHNIEVPTAHLAAGVYIITLRNYRKVLMREKLVKL